MWSRDGGRKWGKQDGVKKCADLDSKIYQFREKTTPPTPELRDS